jgi:hypothetical protein
MKPAFALHPHPLTPCSFIDGVAVAVEFFADGAARYVYKVRGDIDRLDIPVSRSALRTDELWRQTCFEAFIRGSGEAAYDEFNFSPSGEWAAYRFEHYRSGMVELELGSPPSIACQRHRDQLQVEVILGTSDRRWNQVQLGLSAVVRDRHGIVYYWALSHPPGKPDFHHDAGFVAVT